MFISLFLLTKKAQKKKLSKKKSAEKQGFSPSAEGEEGYAPSTAPPFEKGGRKLSAG